MSISRTPMKSSSNSQRNSLSIGPSQQSEMDTPDDSSSGFNITLRNTKCKLYKGQLPSALSDLMDEMHTLFSKFESQQNSKLESIIKSMHNISTQNMDIQNSMDFLSHKYDSLLNSFQSLQNENLAYKKRIESLENKLEQQERFLKSTSIEIKNIPKPTNENNTTLTEIVKTLGETINQPILDSDIHQVYRIMTKQDLSNTIIARFTTQTTKDNFIKKSKLFNKERKEKKLSTSDLSLPGSSRPIYITESLTAKTRHLHYLARQFVKKNNYESCWTSYGKVYIKQKYDKASIRIESEDDLRKLIVSK